MKLLAGRRLGPAYMRVTTSLPADDARFLAVIQAQEYVFIISVVALGLYAPVSQLHAKQFELDALNRNVEALMRERPDVLSTLNVQLVQLALTDPLTGLLNRRAFLDNAQRELESARRPHRQLALMKRCTQPRAPAATGWWRSHHRPEAAHY